MLAVVPTALLVFVLAAFLLMRNGRSVRAAYFFSILFVAILVALSALGGLARAMGLAIADPKTTVPGCVEQEVQLGRAQGLGGPGRQAQAPPQPPSPPSVTFPPFPSLPIPTFEPIPVPTIPPFPVPRPFPIPDTPGAGVSFECPESSGRSGAGAEAVRSGVLFALASALAWANAVGARKLLNEEDQHAR